MIIFTLLLIYLLTILIILFPIPTITIGIILLILFITFWAWIPNDKQDNLSSTEKEEIEHPFEEFETYTDLFGDDF